MALESVKEGTGHRVLEGERRAGLGTESVGVGWDILILEVREGIREVVVLRSIRLGEGEVVVGCIGLADRPEVDGSPALGEGHRRAVAAGKGGNLVEVDARMGDVRVLETGGQCGSIGTSLGDGKTYDLVEDKTWLMGIGGIRERRKESGKIRKLSRSQILERRENIYKNHGSMSPASVNCGAG